MFKALRWLHRNETRYPLNVKRSLSIKYLLQSK